MDEILTAIRRIIADDEQASVSPSASRTGQESAAKSSTGSQSSEAPARRPATDDDVLELTDALNEDGTVRRLAPIGGSTHRPAGGASDPPPPAAPSEAKAAPKVNPEPEAAHPHQVPSSSAVGSGRAPEDHLVSEVTSLAAAAAFARVASAPRPHREPPLVGDRPLDDIVRELLRPLLQTWLDENLPQIVERLVESEIARLGRSDAG